MRRRRYVVPILGALCITALALISTRPSGGEYPPELKFLWEIDPHPQILVEMNSTGPSLSTAIPYRLLVFRSWQPTERVLKSVYGHLHGHTGWSVQAGREGYGGPRKQLVARMNSRPVHGQIELVVRPSCPVTVSVTDYRQPLSRAVYWRWVIRARFGI